MTIKINTPLLDLNKDKGQKMTEENVKAFLHGWLGKFCLFIFSILD